MREIQANIDRPMALQNYLRRTFPSIPPAILRKALENRDVRAPGARACTRMSSSTRTTN